MKQFTFLVTEHGLGGKRQCVYIVKAKTEKSAENKLWLVCGDRSWEIEPFKAGVLWDDHSISDMRGITYPISRMG